MSNQFKEISFYPRLARLNPFSWSTGLQAGLLLTLVMAGILVVTHTDSLSLIVAPSAPRVIDDFEVKWWQQYNSVRVKVSQIFSPFVEKGVIHACSEGNPICTWVLRGMPTEAGVPLVFMPLILFGLASTLVGLVNLLFVKNLKRRLLSLGLVVMMVLSMFTPFPFHLFKGAETFIGYGAPLAYAVTDATLVERGQWYDIYDVSNATHKLKEQRIPIGRNYVNVSGNWVQYQLTQDELANKITVRAGLIGVEIRINSFNASLYDPDMKAKHADEYFIGEIWDGVKWIDIGVQKSAPSSVLTVGNKTGVFVKKEFSTPLAYGNLVYEFREKGQLKHILTLCSKTVAPVPFRLWEVHDNVKALLVNNDPVTTTLTKTRDEAKTFSFRDSLGELKLRDHQEDAGLAFANSTITPVVDGLRVKYLFFESVKWKLKAGGCVTVVDPTETQNNPTNDFITDCTSGCGKSEGGGNLPYQEDAGAEARAMMEWAHILPSGASVSSVVWEYEGNADGAGSGAIKRIVTNLPIGNAGATALSDLVRDSTPTYVSSFDPVLTPTKGVTLGSQANTDMQNSILTGGGGTFAIGLRKVSGSTGYDRVWSEEGRGGTNPSTPPTIVITYTTNTAPTVDSCTLTNGHGSPAQTMFSQLTYTIRCGFTDTDGAGNIATVAIQITSASNIEARFTQGGASGTFSESDSPGYIVVESSSSVTSAQTALTVSWSLTLDWDFPTEILTGVVAKICDASNSCATSNQLNFFSNENDVSIASLTVSDTRHNVGGTITVSWNTFYQGSTVSIPNAQIQVWGLHTEASGVAVTVASGASLATVSMTLTLSGSVRADTMHVEINLAGDGATTDVTGTTQSVVSDRISLTLVDVDDARRNIGTAATMLVTMAWEYDRVAITNTGQLTMNSRLSSWNSGNSRHEVTSNSAEVNIGTFGTSITASDTTFNISTYSSNLTPTSVIWDQMKATNLTTSSAEGNLWVFRITGTYDYDESNCNCVIRITDSGGSILGDTTLSGGIRDYTVTTSLQSSGSIALAPSVDNSFGLTRVGQTQTAEIQFLNAITNSLIDIWGLRTSLATRAAGFDGGTNTLNFDATQAGSINPNVKVYWTERGKPETVRQGSSVRTEGTHWSWTNSMMSLTVASGLGSLIEVVYPALPAPGVSQPGSGGFESPTTTTQPAPAPATPTAPQAVVSPEIPSNLVTLGMAAIVVLIVGGFVIQKVNERGSPSSSLRKLGGARAWRKKGMKKHKNAWR